MFWFNFALAEPITSIDNIPSLGNPNAKVTVIEYGSLTCPHCKRFQDDVFPTINEKYIKTGKIKFIYFPFVTPPFELALGMQIIADCAGGDARYKIIDEYYKNQDNVFKETQSSNGPMNYIISIGEKYGLSKGQAKMCLNTQLMQDNIVSIMNNAEKTYGIHGTPSIIINGKLITMPNNQEYSAAFVSAAIDSALVSVSNKQVANPKLVKKAKKH